MPATTSTAPSTVCQPTGSASSSAPIAVGQTGVAYVTIAATEGPATRITRRFRMYAQPVPTAPSTSRAAAAPGPGQLGGPASQGATMASSTVAQPICRVDSAAADGCRLAYQRRV